MNRLAYIFFFALIGCAKAPVSPPVQQPQSPFIGIETSDLTDAQKAILREAKTDFDRVRKGLLPTCSDAPDSSFADGGTSVYECGNYQLTIVKSLYSFQGIDGYLYGPVMSFDTNKSISDVRFYTKEELSKLLK